MLELRRPERCPECGEASFVRVLHGYPAPEARAMIERGDAVSGGCFIALNLPDWRCRNCEHEWLDLSDPARQELEELTKRIIARGQAAAK